jgi:hypothetical protein
MGPKARGDVEPICWRAGDKAEADADLPSIVRRWSVLSVPHWTESMLDGLQKRANKEEVVEHPRGRARCGAGAAGGGPEPPPGVRPARTRRAMAP